jgi:hypothetical protein
LYEVIPKRVVPIIGNTSAESLSSPAYYGPRKIYITIYLATSSSLFRILLKKRTVMGIENGASPSNLKETCVCYTSISVMEARPFTICIPEKATKALVEVFSFECE